MNAALKTSCGTGAGPLHADVSFPDLKTMISHLLGASSAIVAFPTRTILASFTHHARLLSLCRALWHFSTHLETHSVNSRTLQIPLKHLSGHYRVMSEIRIFLTLRSSSVVYVSNYSSQSAFAFFRGRRPSADALERVCSDAGTKPESQPEKRRWSCTDHQTRQLDLLDPGLSIFSFKRKYR